jgi:hypothetical protein
MQMRRLSGVVLAGAMVMLPAFSQSASAQAAPAAQQPAAEQAAGQPAAEQKPAVQKLTYEGDTVIIAYQTNAGKDADYEQVIAKLKDALAKSTEPQAKQQAAGWTVTKLSKPLQADGGSTYLHVINVVPGADYSIVNIVYAASNDEEKRAFYELYKGALKGGLVQWNGTTVSKLGQ